MRDTPMTITSMTGEGVIPIAVTANLHHGKGSTHCHTFFEFVYIDHGFALHTCNKVTSIVSEGDWFLIRPNEPHNYVSAYNTQLYNCLFEAEALRDSMDMFLSLPGMKDVLLSQSPFEKLNLDYAQRLKLKTCLNKMMAEREERKLGWELKLKSLLEDFLVFYARVYHESGNILLENNANFSKIYNVLKYVEEHYTANMTVKDMAQAAQLSPDYMAKLFKASMGLTPAEYARNFRIAKSMELLEDTDRPVAEIAAELGFSDSSVFSRLFKQVAGISPTAFKRISDEERAKEN